MEGGEDGVSVRDLITSLCDEFKHSPHLVSFGVCESPLNI